jgi:2,3-bisphosphoglycerate-independent phosphoglycerate mutase
MKHLVCFLNSITDINLKQLSALSPLEMAKTKNLDALCSKWGLHALDREGLVEKFDSFGMSLGMSLSKGSLNTGYLEASSESMLLNENEWAFSLRFISQGDGVLVDTSNQLVSDQEGEHLCDLLNRFLNKEDLKFIHLKGPKAILVGKDASLFQSLWGKSLHLKETLGSHWKDALPGGRENQGLILLVEKILELLEKSEVNTLRSELEELPINGVFLSGGGTKLPGYYFEDDGLYKDALVYSKDPSMKGLSKLLGMEFWDLPQEKKTYDHLRLISSGLAKKFEERESIFLDIDYLWESTYKGDLREKVKRIEYLDRYWIEPLLRLCESLGVEFTILSLDKVDINQGCRVEGDVFCLSSLPSFQGTRVEHFNEKSLTLAKKGKLLSSVKLVGPAQKGS